MLFKGTCEPPLQSIDSKGLLAASSQKVALFMKGLRHLSVCIHLMPLGQKVALFMKGLRLLKIYLANGLWMSESSPVYEGIKTMIGTSNLT